MTTHRALGINLSPGTTPWNLYAYFVVALISSAYAGAMAMLQPGLLQVMDIEQSQHGTVTGMLTALQEVVLITMMGPCGAIADRVGRRGVYMAGLALTGIGFVLYPWANSIGELVVYRLIVAFGGAAMVGMLVTVIADYASNEDRGKANGIQGFIATIGAFIPPLLATLPAVFARGGMTELDAVRATYGVSGSLAVIGVFVAWIGLSPTVGKVADAAKETLLQSLKNGLAAAKDTGVALSYGAAFISRGDLAVTGAFMGLWLVQHGVQNLGLTPSEAMFQLAVPRTLVTVAGAMVGSLLIGFITDKVTRATAVTMSAGLAAFIYLSVGLIDDPTAPWVFGLLAVMGVAEIGAFVSSQALVGQQAPASRRGAVIGFYGVMGAIGILVATAGGGWMFSNISPATPFVVFGALNLVVFVWGLMVRKRVVIPAENLVAQP